MKRYRVLFGEPEAVGETLDRLEQETLGLKVEGASSAYDPEGRVWLTVVVSFQEATG